ncbi:MAG: 4Fe-4S binding protein, partial [Plesiomonas sp.]|nr:4Fe-4S binding protein [Plesiomonas sp.]
SMNDSLRAGLGMLFSWKVAVLVVIVVASVVMARPFCKYLCPLGAFYGLFNRFSLYQLAIDHRACVDCKKCEQVCPMQVEVTKNINSTECIRCGRCKAACPQDAIHSGFTVTELQAKNAKE